MRTQSESTAGTYIYRIWTTSTKIEPLTLGELITAAKEAGYESPADLSIEQ